MSSVTNEKFPLSMGWEGWVILCDYPYAGKKYHLNAAFFCLFKYLILFIF
jgi:hypothetical protein